MQLQSVFKCWSAIVSLVLRAALISSVPCFAWAGCRPPPRALCSARWPPLVIRMPTLGPSSTHAVDARTSSGSHFFKDFTTVSCNAMDTNVWKKVSCERCWAQMWRTPGISDSAEWWNKTEENLIIIEKSLKLYSQKRPGDATASYNCLPTPNRAESRSWTVTGSSWGEEDSQRTVFDSYKWTQSLSRRPGLSC